MNIFLALIKLYQLVDLFSLALPDRFFLLYWDGKKGLVNGLYHFCSTDPQFLRFVNWLLIGVNQEKRAVPSTFFSYVIRTNMQVFVAISGQLTTHKNCGSVEQKWYRPFTRPFLSYPNVKEKKRSDNARLRFILSFLADTITMLFIQVRFYGSNKFPYQSGPYY